MSKPNLKSAKIVAIMLMVALVASLITYQWTTASFQGSLESLPFYVGAPQPYSYVIDTNVTHYFAFNGTTGYLKQTSTNASIVINNVNGNVSSNGNVFVKRGTYQISSVTLSNAVHWIGEDGCVWNLTAKPSITVNANTTFEGIEFYSDLDGYGHVLIRDDTTFKDCSFNLSLDTTDLVGVFYVDTANSQKVKFQDCVVTTSGKSGAEYFCLFYADVNFDLFEVDGLRVNACTADGTVGRIAFFMLDSASTVTTLTFHNILLRQFTMDDPSDFLYVYGAATTSTVDGLKYESQAGGTSYLKTLRIRGSQAVISNIISIPCDHSEFRVLKLSINGWVFGGLGGIDLGSGTTYPSRATINNVHLYKAGITMNTGWSQLAMTNCEFVNSRFLVLDEGAPAGQEKRVVLDNCIFDFPDGTGILYPILLSYDQGIKLSTLQITNCRFFNVQDALLAVSGASSYPTHIILDNVVLDPRIDSVYPKLFSGDARTNDNQIVWIFNSYMTTSNPPLGDWNNLRPNDRFDNVKWNNTATSAVTYSENCGSQANTTSTTFVFNHNLVTTPVLVLASFNDTAVDGWTWTATTTQITITVTGTLAGNVTCYWYGQIWY